MWTPGPQRLALLVAVGAAAATAAIAAAASLRFAYEAPGLRVALETAAALVALLAAYLMLGRFLRARRLDSLVLAAGLGVLSMTNLLGALILAVRPEHDWRLLATGGSFVGSILFAAAAFARPVVLRAGRSGPPALAAAGAFVLATAGVLLVLEAVTPGPAPAPAANPAAPDFESSPFVLAAQLGAMAMYCAAAAGFLRRGASERDRFLSSVGVAATLAAFARLHYVLFAPAHSNLVHTGDVFRVLFYGVLLVGAGREIETYWRGLAGAKVLEERRRIARELHDGVAQELAFIGRRARRLGGGSDEAREIAAAAERALGDSRRAIAALTRPLDQPLAAVLAEAVADVAARLGVELDLALAPDVEVDPDRREALVRIACEAVANAARHGGVGAVRVELAGGDTVRFAVADAGRGFDPGAAAPGRYGLAIMRERAEAVGGAFRLLSAPGAGTRVEVEL